MHIQTTEAICPPMRPEIQRLIISQEQYDIGYSKPHFRNQFERPVVTYHPFDDPVRLIDGNISVQDPGCTPVRVNAESNHQDQRPGQPIHNNNQPT